jgi:uncharacterized membrane protein
MKILKIIGYVIAALVVVVLILTFKFWRLLLLVKFTRVITQMIITDNQITITYEG